MIGEVSSLQYMLLRVCIERTDSENSERLRVLQVGGFFKVDINLWTIWPEYNVIHFGVQCHILTIYKANVL